MPEANMNVVRGWASKKDSLWGNDFGIGIICVEYYPTTGRKNQLT